MSPNQNRPLIWHNCVRCTELAQADGQERKGFSITRSNVPVRYPPSIVGTWTKLRDSAGAYPRIRRISMYSHDVYQPLEYQLKENRGQGVCNITSSLLIRRSFDGHQQKFLRYLDGSE